MSQFIWRVAFRPAFSRTGRVWHPSIRRRISTKPDDLAPNASQKSRSRLVRLTSRLPKFLRGYTTPLINAPITHISAFILLHELTAVVPLLGLAATFHYTQWMPPFLGEGKWVADGVEKFGKYFRKKGWLGQERARRHTWWSRGEGGTRVVVELATAYAITKAMLPLRLVLSVWATPWFARIAIVPSTNLLGRIFRRSKK